MIGTKRLQRVHLSMLADLHTAGGVADIDTHGRLIVGQQRVPAPGDPATWLLMVAHGLLGGENGRLIVTELGREMAEGVIAGRTREAV